MGVSGYAADVRRSHPDVLEHQTTLIPAVGLILGLLIFILFYKLDEKQVQSMIEEMEAEGRIREVSE